MAGGLGTLRVATRRSALAKAQSADVGRRLAALLGQELELVEVTTVGDLDTSPLSQIGGTGVFVTAVRQAVLDGAADVAVHSLKDLPTTPDAQLVLAAVPAREDPRDVLVSRGGATLADLPPGARVGTGSPRRRAQLAVARPDLEILDLRGNVDTRLARVLGGPGAPPPDLDAIVLAAAGLARLGRSEVISEHLDPDLFVPAPGQGALAVEVAAGSELASRARALDDPATRAAVQAERSVLATLAVGCSAPVGALAEVHDAALGATGQPGVDGTVHLRAFLAAADGTVRIRTAAGPATSAGSIGARVAAELLDDDPNLTTTSPTTDRGELIR